jgi:hypothetical protein
MAPALDEDDVALLEGQRAVERVEALLAQMSTAAGSLHRGARLAAPEAAAAARRAPQAVRSREEPHGSAEAARQGRSEELLALLHESERVATLGGAGLWSSPSGGGGAGDADEHVRMLRSLVFERRSDDIEVPYGSLDTVRAYAEQCAPASGGEEGALEAGETVRQTYDAARALARDARARRQEERETWLLLDMLYSSGLDPVGGDEFGSAQVALNREFHGNSALQLWNVLVRWLHRVHQERLGMRPLAGAGGAGRSQGKYRPMTVASLSKQGRGVADPDATLRGGAALHADDADDQGELLGELWRLVRQGAFYDELGDEDRAREHRELLARADEACAEFGEPWRLASLMGGRPYHLSERREGNAYRALWRDATAQLALQLFARAEAEGGAPEATSSRVCAAQLEAALYAVLGGELDALQRSSLLRGWREHVWAVARAVVQAHVDRNCVLSRRAAMLTIGHIPGPLAGAARPGDESHEERALRRAEALLRRFGAGPEEAFEGAAGDVPRAELFFFAAQRAAASGGLRALLRDALCPRLAGPAWRSLGAATVAQVCRGRSEAPGEHVPVQGKNVIVAGQALEEDTPPAPVWEDEGHAAAAQQLRFAAHLAVFMGHLSSVHGVVVDTSPVSGPVTEALCTAYARFLLADDAGDTTALERYGSLPALFPVLRGVPGLELALLAAMIEAATVGAPEARLALRSRWHALLPHRHLLPQACRMALRNVRRQWRDGSGAPCALLRRALDTVRQQRDRLEPLDAPAADAAERQLAHEHVRARALHTWRWLAEDPLTRTEALCWANALLRDLAQEELAGAPRAPGAPRPAQLAHQLLRDMDRNFPSLLADIAAAAGVPEVRMGGGSLARARRELDQWRAFLVALEAVQHWKQGLAWLDEQGYDRDQPPPRQLAQDVHRSAFDTARRLRAALEFPGGWLLDDKDHDKDHDGRADAEAKAEAEAQAEAEAEEPPPEIEAHVFRADPVTPQERAERDAMLGAPGRPGSLRRDAVAFLVHAMVDVLRVAADKTESLGLPVDAVAELHQAMRAVAGILAVPNLHLLECLSRHDAEQLLEKMRRSGLELLRIRGYVESPLWPLPPSQQQQQLTGQSTPQPTPRSAA